LDTGVADLRGMAGALEDKAISDHRAAAGCYGQIRADTQRLALMVDDLLELSCIDAGALWLSATPPAWVT
jgi:signal transduction histidine kinase